MVNYRQEEFSINTGIFQGDCTSGFLFILCLLPLSLLLKRSGLGYRINTNDLKVISHLLFMDDLKLYAANDNHLNDMINIMKRFSNDISMAFGFDKCNKLTVKRGKTIQSKPITMEDDKRIKSLAFDQHYRYLGFSERLKTDSPTKSLKREYFSHIKMILKSELSSKNTIDAITSQLARDVASWSSFSRHKATLLRRLYNVVWS